MSARLIAPNGSTVVVADEKAERLLALGYRRPPAKAAQPVTSAKRTEPPAPADPAAPKRAKKSKSKK